MNSFTKAVSTTFLASRKPTTVAVASLRSRQAWIRIGSPMAKVTVKIEGLKELDRALGQLPKSAAKATLRKVLKEAAEPVARLARQKAPKDEYHLHESIDVSTRLNRRQIQLHREEGGRAFQEMFIDRKS